MGSTAPKSIQKEEIAGLQLAPRKGIDNFPSSVTSIQSSLQLAPRKGIDKGTRAETLWRSSCNSRLERGLTAVGILDHQLDNPLQLAPRKGIDRTLTQKQTTKSRCNSRLERGLTATGTRRGVMQGVATRASKGD